MEETGREFRAKAKKIFVQMLLEPASEVRIPPAASWMDQSGLKNRLQTQTYMYFWGLSAVSHEQLLTFRAF